MTVRTVQRPRRSERVRPLGLPPSSAKPTGELIVQRRRREGACLLRYCVLYLLGVLMVLLYLNGFAMLNAKTRQKIELKQALQREQGRYQRLWTRVEEARAPERVERYALQTGMVRTDPAQAVALEYFATHLLPLKAKVAQWMPGEGKGR